MVVVVVVVGVDVSGGGIVDFDDAQDRADFSFTT